MVECPEPRGNDTLWKARFKSKKYRLTLATWNVEWLFDGVDDPAQVPLKYQGVSKVSGRLKEMASVLSNIDADIINLAEVEHCKILSLLAQNLAGEVGGSYEPYLVEGTDVFLKQQVALLSQLVPKGRIARIS